MSELLISEANTRDDTFISLFHDKSWFYWIGHELFHIVSDHYSKFRLTTTHSEYLRLSLEGLLHKDMPTVQQYLTILYEVKITHLELLESIWILAFKDKFNFEISKNTWAKLACNYCEWMKRNNIMTYPFIPRDLEDADCKIIFELCTQQFIYNCLHQNLVHIDIIQIFIFQYFKEKHMCNGRPYTFEIYFENLYWYTRYITRKYIDEKEPPSEIREGRRDRYTYS